MVGKLAPNSTHSTRGLVRYVAGWGYFRTVPSQNGDKFVTSPAPSPIVGRVVIAKSGSSLDLRLFSIQLTRFDIMNHLGLTIEKESRKTECALYAISGEMFSKECVLTTSTPNKYVALSVGSINIDKKVVENTSVEAKFVIRLRRKSVFVSKLKVIPRPL